MAHIFDLFMTALRSLSLWYHRLCVHCYITNVEIESTSDIHNIYYEKRSHEICIYHFSIHANWKLTLNEFRQVKMNVCVCVILSRFNENE